MTARPFWRLWAAAVLALGPRLAVAVADEPTVIVELEPRHIVAPILNLGGTETVSLRLRNTSGKSLEFSTSQWLVIERADSPGKAVFAPPPPFLPLDLKPNEAIALTWRLKTTAADAYVEDPTPTYPPSPGRHLVRAYLRAKGQPAFQAIVSEFEVGESPLRVGLRRALLGLGAVAGLGGIAAGIARFRRARAA